LSDSLSKTIDKVHAFAQRKLGKMSWTPGYLIIRRGVERPDGRDCRMEVSHVLPSDVEESRVDHIFEIYRSRRQRSSMILYRVKPCDCGKCIHPNIRSIVG